MGPNSTVLLLKPNVIRFPTKKINLFVSSVRYLIATPNYIERCCQRVSASGFLGDEKSNTHPRLDEKSVGDENFSLSIIYPLHLIYTRKDLAEIRDPQV